MTIVPDRHGTGTNALLLAPPQAIAPAFGPGSCERHAAPGRRGRRRARSRSRALARRSTSTPRRISTPSARRSPRSGAAPHGPAGCSGSSTIPPAGDGLARRARRDPRGPAGRRPRRAARATAARRERNRRRRARARPQGGVEGRGTDPSAGDGRARGAGTGARRSGRQGPPPRPGRARRVAGGAARRAGRADLRSPITVSCAPTPGVDASNVPGEDEVIPLPLDPDGSARRLRAALRERLGVGFGVVITDSFGRAWRHGQVDVAIGCAGVAPLAGLAWPDRRSRPRAAGDVDRDADELAAAADLVRAQGSRRAGGARPRRRAATSPRRTGRERRRSCGSAPRICSGSRVRRRRRCDRGRAL